MMKLATMSGCDTATECEALTSIVVDPARLAIARSESVGMAMSLLATAYQDGIVFHAGSPEGRRASPCRLDAA
jgi:hypothetical protein